MSKETRAAVDAWIEAIKDRPETFIIGEFTIFDTKSKLSVWRGTISYFYSPYCWPGIINSIRLGYWCRRLHGYQIALKTSSGTEQLEVKP